MTTVGRPDQKVDRDEVFIEYTKSICPVCKTVIDAEVNIRDNRVIMRNRCPEHGPLEALVYSLVNSAQPHASARPSGPPANRGSCRRCTRRSACSQPLLPSPRKRRGWMSTARCTGSQAATRRCAASSDASPASSTGRSPRPTKKR